MSFQKYLDVVSGNFKKAVKVEWLNPDETVAFEFTNALYDINAELSVNYHNGGRRTCTLTLNNDRNQFPINFNNIWFGQKFKLWMGVYLDEKTPYYFPQGVFYVNDPNETFQPSTRTIKINGVDKWAFLDGTLHGKLSGTYQTNIGNNLVDATRELLTLPIGSVTTRVTPENMDDYFNIANNDDHYFKYNEETKKYTSTNKNVKSSIAKTVLTAKRDMRVSFRYSYSSAAADYFTLICADKEVEHLAYGQTTIKNFTGILLAGQSITFQYYKNDDRTHEYDDECTFFDIIISDIGNVIDPVTPFISPYFLTKMVYVLNTDSEYDKNKTYYKYNKLTSSYDVYSYDSSSKWDSEYTTVYVKSEVWKCPYTAKVERGKTYADVLLEYATILCAHIYYDVDGRLIMEPMTDEADDITDTNKEVVWDFTVEEKQLLGLEQTYNFKKVHNDIIVLGNIVNGYQFKARVQNQNEMSDTCVQKIGLKTKDPIEDNQYYSDDQCKELAMYHAKVDTILQKSGSISSTPLYHLDVNKIVTVSTPNNNMSREKFLISGYTLNSSNSMSVNVTSVNILKDFSVVEVDVYE